MMTMSSTFLHEKSISNTEKFRDKIGEQPTSVLQFKHKVQIIEFSPFLWSHDLIAIASPSEIKIGRIGFQEENENQLEDLSYNEIESFPINSRVTAMAWSPETNINAAPKNVILASANATFKIIIYGSYLTKEEDSISEKMIDAHSGYINCISYDSTGELMASASDDLTCKIWSASECYEQLCVFYLRSPGMAVCWHKDEHGKLLVGEKFGTITMYNLSTKQAILSLRSQAYPLMSMDWALAHSSYVAAVCGGNLVVWILSSPSSPFIERTMHQDGGLKVKFFPLSEFKVFTLGAHDNSVKVFQTSPPSPFPVILNSNSMMSSTLTCHQHLPVVCSASDDKILMWKLNF